MFRGRCPVCGHQDINVESKIDAQSKRIYNSLSSSIQKLVSEISKKLSHHCGFSYTDKREQLRFYNCINHHNKHAVKKSLNNYIRRKDYMKGKGYSYICAIIISESNTIKKQIEYENKHLDSLPPKIKVKSK